MCGWYNMVINVELDLLLSTIFVKTKIQEFSFRFKNDTHTTKINHLK